MVTSQRGQTVLAVSILIAIISTTAAYTITPRLVSYWVNSVDLSLKVSALDAVNEFGRQLQVYQFMGRQLEAIPGASATGALVGPFVPTPVGGSACPVGYSRVDVSNPNLGQSSPGGTGSLSNQSRPAFGVTTPNGVGNVVLCVPNGNVEIQDANRPHVQYIFRITSTVPAPDRLRMYAEAQIKNKQESLWQRRSSHPQTESYLHFLKLFISVAFAENYWPSPPAVSPAVSLSGTQPACAAAGFVPSCRWVCGTNARCIDVQMSVSGVNAGTGLSRVQQVFVFPEDL